jgi:hypothetical protein
LRFFWILLLVLAIGISACKPITENAPEIEVKDAWVRATGAMGDANGELPTAEGHSGMNEGGVNSAAYMVIANKGGINDRLLRVEGDVAQAIELHRSEIVDGVMRMSPMQNIEIPAGGQAELKPGSLHVMLIGIKGKLKPGDQVSLILVFELSGNLTVQAEVRGP